jgi:type II secretory pathway pseudopilin PulG
MELLLSITIIGILAGLSAPFYETFVRRNDLDITTQQLSSALRRAQSYARVGDMDSAWSVEIAGGNITLFKGTSYGSRDTNYDESTDIPDSITPSGISEVQFAKFTSLPNATGTFTLTSSTNDVRTVVVNAQGMVQE